MRFTEPFAPASSGSATSRSHESATIPLTPNFKGADSTPPRCVPRPGRPGQARLLQERVRRIEGNAPPSQRVQDEMVSRVIGGELLRRHHAGELHLAGGDPAHEGGAGESGG